MRHNKACIIYWIVISYEIKIWYAACVVFVSRFQSVWKIPVNKYIRK